MLDEWTCCVMLLILTVVCHIISVGTLPEQNVLGEETGRGSEESHPLSPCPCAIG